MDDVGVIEGETEDVAELEGEFDGVSVMEGVSVGDDETDAVADDEPDSEGVPVCESVMEGVREEEPVPDGVTVELLVQDPVGVEVLVVGGVSVEVLVVEGVPAGEVAECVSTNPQHSSRSNTGRGMPPPRGTPDGTIPDRGRATCDKKQRRRLRGATVPAFPHQRAPQKKTPGVPPFTEPFNKAAAAGTHTRVVCCRCTARWCGGPVGAPRKAKGRVKHKKN